MAEPRDRPYCAGGISQVQITVLFRVVSDVVGQYWIALQLFLASLSELLQLLLHLGTEQAQDFFPFSASPPPTNFLFPPPLLAKTHPSPRLALFPNNAPI